MYNSLYFLGSPLRDLVGLSVWDDLLNIDYKSSNFDVRSINYASFSFAIYSAVSALYLYSSILEITFFINFCIIYW